MSGATANRAVFFSGLTVVLALAGMLLVPTTIFRGLAGGAIIVVLVSVALSMTLLPALMALFADRLVKPGCIFGRGRTLEHGRAGGFWDRESRSRDGAPVGLADPRRDLHDPPLGAVLGAVARRRRRPRDQDGLLGDRARSPTGSRRRTRSTSSSRSSPGRAGQQSTAQVVIPGAASDPTVSSAGSRRSTPRSRTTPRSRKPLLAPDEPGRDGHARPIPDRGRGHRRAERGRGRRGRRAAGHIRPAGVRAGLRRARRRRHGVREGLLRHLGAVHADHHPAGARPVVHPAHGRVPLDRRAGEGDRDEPAVGGGSVRAHRR